MTGTIINKTNMAKAEDWLLSLIYNETTAWIPIKNGGMGISSDFMMISRLGYTAQAGS